MIDSCYDMQLTSSLGTALKMTTLSMKAVRTMKCDCISLNITKIYYIKTLAPIFIDLPQSSALEVSFVMKLVFKSLEGDVQLVS